MSALKKYKARVKELEEGIISISSKNDLLEARVKELEEGIISISSKNDLLEAVAQAATALMSYSLQEIRAARPHFNSI